MELQHYLQHIKDRGPLVEAITNYVTITDCANILLSVGASPAMCESADEAYEFTKLSSAVYLNIGTLTKEQELAMLQAIKAADELTIPVVLDPVGCGAIPRRVDFIHKLRSFGKISVLKGNVGEIKTLAGAKTEVKGVDSLDEGEDAVEVCEQLAKDWKCIVVATGKRDILTNGKQTATVDNGSEMFTKITGAGCMLGALLAGFSGANPEALFEANLAGLVTMGIAGEKASKLDRGNLPGSFRSYLMDEIHQVNLKTDAGLANYQLHSI
jgi:hydroxyethylthiazole kinase